MKQQASDGSPTRRILNTREASQYINRKETTLETWRSRGGGPKYVKFGKSVGYPIDYLDAYIDQSTRTSTSDTGAE